ncbi:MAG: PilZ domain-containing protein [Pseudomonadales bacterium]
MEITAQLRRPPDLGNQPDQRAHPRYAEEQSLLAQIVMTPGDQRLTGQIVAGRTVDVSLGGIQFLCAEPLLPRTLIDLWVNASDTPEKFFLIGVVRWCRAVPGTGVTFEQARMPASSGASRSRAEMPDRHYAVGAALRQSGTTDHERWREYLERRHER